MRFVYGFYNVSAVEQITIFDVVFLIEEFPTEHFFLFASGHKTLYFKALGFLKELNKMFLVFVMKTQTKV